MYSGTKLYPMVVVIGENIYVLSEILLSDPMFVVYNPITKKNGEFCHNHVPLSVSYGSFNGIPFVAVLLLASLVVVISVSIPSLRNGSIQFLKIKETREHICMFGRPDF